MCTLIPSKSFCFDSVTLPLYPPGPSFLKSPVEWKEPFWFSDYICTYYILHITLLITYLKLLNCDISSPIEGMKWRSEVLLLKTGSGCDALPLSFNISDNTIIFALFYLFYVFSKPMLQPLGHSMPQWPHLQNGNKNPWSEFCITYWACIIAAQADKGYYWYFYTFSFCNSPIFPYSSQRQFLTVIEGNSSSVIFIIHSFLHSVSLSIIQDLFCLFVCLFLSFK